MSQTTISTDLFNFSFHFLFPFIKGGGGRPRRLSNYIFPSNIQNLTFLLFCYSAATLFPFRLSPIDFKKCPSLRAVTLLLTEVNPIRGF